MDVALEASARHGNGRPVQTLGPLIHNPQALEHLDHRGVGQIDDLEQVERGCVVIRAHGIPLADFRTLQEKKRAKHIKFYNATCSEVARVQAAIKQHAQRGGFVLILGSAPHAEVRWPAKTGHNRSSQTEIMRCELAK